ncbi:hypothetical protein CPB86DRAFT_816614 [Serendipita vermifera]|nr:hypothetical protein CPB86DRAFT_816614 [Serendipita vermifera]
MANFNVLPLELIDEIIKLVLVTYTRRLPTIGSDASCFAPSCTDMKELPSMSGAESLDSARAVCSISLKSETNCSQSSFGFYVMAASLRLVNRTFNKICAPLLYKYVNLVEKIDSSENFQTTWQSIIIPYSHRIQTLYLYADSPFSHLGNDTGKYAAGIFSVCNQLVTLGLYYHYRAHRPMVAREVVFLAEKGKLAHLGIYSQYVLKSQNGGWNHNSSAIGNLINCLAVSPQARGSIKSLELALENISMETFIAIHTNFPSLRSLTFRKALDTLLQYPSQVEQERHLSPYRGLRRLQLTGCKVGSSARIPFLLHLFPTLKELLVSGVGSSYIQREWNYDPIILRQAQMPLDLLHIENMHQKEVQELINLRTTTLIVASVQLRYIRNIFKDDANSFPGLKVLRLEPEQCDPSQRDPYRWLELSAICKGRAIELRRDAVSVFGLKQELH